MELVLFGLLALFALALTAIAVTSLWWMLHAWRTPASLLATGFPTGDTPPRHSFSLIVPARHEEAVLEATLERLAGGHHPQFEVLAVTGDDDPDTRAVAQQAAARHPDRIRVLVDDSQPKNKPKALNTALAACTGTVTAVFDAEDEVHPDLLRHVDARFTETGADATSKAATRAAGKNSTTWFPPPRCAASPTAFPRPAKPSAAPGSWHLRRGAQRVEIRKIQGSPL